ncbi:MULTISPECIES: hypothetical protein [Ruegeria]|uniref:hypothetical protein n=1 Tax=Ruegeria TaxID=97050 RepID=UPI00147E4A5D|nr:MULTISPECIES: hypothetical protein [Ruegeria]NOD48885.1 hypothetical protein [Ruegeria sp. HKCCD5849]NOD53532.1 hypothetical protein [Ruegeria sp. HKCCD5851]NOD70207.1 hypothetical protein [Ruegeria sp. HKCCD7303]
MDNGQRLFQDVSHEFHDNSIYALKLVSPDPDNNDWVSELILDIDHIEEWIRQDNEQFSFSVSQVNLCFEGVSDLFVSFSFPKSTVTPLPIDRITRSREPVRIHGIDYSEFAWTIGLNDRRGGRICFHATGYRFESVGKPVTCEEQYIPKHLRLPQ